MTMITNRIGRAGRILAVSAALFVALAPALAEARAGSGGSFGSRGSFSNSAPRATPTAPSAAQPFQRTQSQPAAPQSPLNRATPAPSGGMFNSPLARGIMGGLIGAGIFGLLSGSGLFNGLGSLAGMFGLLLQVGLIAIVAMIALNWWRNRQQPSLATANARSPMGGYGAAPPPASNTSARMDAGQTTTSSGFGSMFGGGLGAKSENQAPVTRELKIDGEDFNAFEHMLGEVQVAYGAEDLTTLRRVATPEIAGYFEDDLADQKRKGQLSKVGDVKLLQGDLSEAWSEADYDYATVAMKFSLIDAVVDRASGRLIEGDLVKPQETTEIWTFVRPTGAKPVDWKLSAIQQVA
jgi:predicted lipid-binding transport protein (Tim44 family)